MNGLTKIEKMFAFIAVDPTDNTEGVISAHIENGLHMPLVGADMARVESLKPLAKMIMEEVGLPPGSVTVVEFSTRTDLETL